MDALIERLLQSTGDGVYRYTFDDGVVLLCNQGFIQLLELELTPEQVVGRKLNELMVYLEAPGTIRRAMEKSEKIHGYQYRFQTLAGHERWVLHDSVLITDPETGTRCVEAIVKDITALKQAQLGLEQSEERLSLALRGADLGLWDWDLVQDQVHYDARWAGMLGYAPGEIAPNIRALEELLHPEDGTRVRRALTRHLDGRAPVFEAEYRLRAKDGAWVWVLAKARVMTRDADDRPLRLVGTHLDITERKLNEEALHAYHLKLEQMVEDRTLDLQRVNEELQRSNSELEQFAYIASHDLQEPLRKITAFGERLRGQYIDSLDATGQDYLARMLSASTRMRTFIDDLLEYSRVNTRGGTFSYITLDEPLRDALDGLEQHLLDTGGTVRSETLPVVSADPEQMTQLFQNLISNALKFSRQGVPPEIDVRGRVREDGMAEISVADNGIGFDDRFQEKIFIPFQRLHTRTEYPGSGIGLAICKKIVQRHGGEIVAHGVPAEGAVFTFVLPVEHATEAAT